MPKIYIKNIFQLISIILVGLLLIFLLIQLNINFSLAVAFVLFITLIPLLMFKPFYALIFLLISRNLIDIFAEQNIFSLAGFDFNLASLFGLLIILFGIIVIIHEYSPKFLNNKVKIPIILPWFVFILIIVVSLTYTLDIDRTIIDLIKILNFFLLFLAGFLLVKGPKQLKILFYGLIISLLIPSLVAIYQIITSNGLYTAEIANRAYGTFFHPNSLAFSLIMALGTILILYLMNAKKTLLPVSRNKLGLLFTFAFYSVILLFTYTRGAWIGLTIILLTVFLLNKKFIILPFYLLALILVIYLPIISTTIDNNFNLNLSNSSIVERLEPETDESSGSLLWRQRIWRETLPAFYQRPVLGWGYGTFPDVRRPLITYESDLSSLEAHNDYFRLLVEVGVLGLLAYLFLYASVIKKAVNIFKNNLNYRAIIIGYLGLVFAILVMSVADNVLRNVPTQWMFWSLTGAVLATSKFKMEDDK